MLQRKIVTVIAFGFLMSASAAQAVPKTFYCYGKDKGRGEVWMTDAFTRDMAADAGMRELSLDEGRQFESFLKTQGVNPSPTYCEAGGYVGYVKLLKDGFSEGRIVRSPWKPANVEQTANLIDHPELHAKYEKLAPGAPAPAVKAESSGGGYLVVEDKKPTTTKVATPRVTKSAPKGSVVKSVDKGSNKSNCHLEGKRYVCPASKQ